MPEVEAIRKPQDERWPHARRVRELLEAQDEKTPVMMTQKDFPLVLRAPAAIRLPPGDLDCQRRSISAFSRPGRALRNSIDARETGWINLSSQEWSASRLAGSVLAPYFRSPMMGWPKTAS